MSDTGSHAVIVGAGQAGFSVAATLRSDGFAGRITLVGGEDLPPYQRPPLSKTYLLGSTSTEQLLLRPASFFVDQRIDLRLGSQVVGIDPVAARLHFADGPSVAYDRLCLATGATPRTLPAAIGGTLGQVLVLRNIADAARLASQLPTVRRVAIIGGGYLGLELAASLAKCGATITVIEAAPRILQRVAAAETADRVRAIHLTNGVNILEGCMVDHLAGDDVVRAVQLADGTQIPAELVVIAIGVEPSIGLAAAAGLAVSGGISVDAYMRTSDQGIWAAGDCASFFWRGKRHRIESVGNAIDTATTAAGSMRGVAAPYKPLPWFWSDQFDLRLQIAGLGDGHDSVHVRPSENGVSHWYYRGAELLAVDAINDSRAYIAGKKLLEMGCSPAPRDVCNPSIDLKSLLRTWGRI